MYVLLNMWWDQQGNGDQHLWTSTTINFMYLYQCILYVGTFLQADALYIHLATGTE